MRRLVLVALVLLAVPATAAARTHDVLVLGPGHRVTHDRDPSLLAPDPPGAPSATATAARVATRRTHPRRTIDSELTRIRRAGVISASRLGTYRHELVLYRRAIRSVSTARRYQLQVVLGNFQSMAARRQVNVTRLPIIFLTLRRNREWWTRGPLLGIDQRVRFEGSQIVWEHYYGQGIQIQWIGTFGGINGRWQARDRRGVRSGLDEAIPLVSHRAGGIAWEYMMPWEGAPPPWSGAIAQGTAIQALSHGATFLHDPRYLRLARRALPLFTHAPPRGVRVRGSHGGPHYLIYTFAPHERVINAFLQSVIGLHDLVAAGGGGLAERLYAPAEREAEREVPSYDTGAWSLYEPGEESDLSYHELVTGFLGDLCDRTSRAVFCRTEKRFARYLHEPPRLVLLTRTARAGHLRLLRFRLSKVSRVGMVVTDPRGRTLLATSAELPYGRHGYYLSVPRRTGAYTVRLRGTDLAGNVGRTVATLRVTR